MKNIITFVLLISVFITFSQEKLTFDLQSTNLEEGEVFCPRPNIVFNIGKATIRPESYPLLDSIITFLKKHNEIVFLEIGGHLDSDVSNASSIILSMNRAQQIADYLVKNGISRTRLLVKGYQDTIPLVPNTTTENKAKNRRVEFKILKIDKE